MKGKNRKTENNLMAKLIASMLIVTLTSANFLFCGSYFASYATSLKPGELDKQTEATLNKNVKFDAYFAEKDGNTHYKVADVNSDEVKLDLNLEVQKEGYLKNAIITLETGDDETKLNYEVSKITDEASMVQKQEENSLALRQVNKDETVKLQLNISPKLEEMMNTQSLNQTSKVVLKATYMDAKGEETPIEKSVDINIGWTGEYEVENEIEVSKYIPLNTNGNKLLVQLLVKTGLKEQENMLSIKNTDLTMNIPTFNGVKAEKIELSAKSTKATNGLDAEEVKFTKDNWSQDGENQTINIKVENKEDEGKVKRGSGKDEYLITLLYPKEAYDSIKTNAISLKTKLSTKIQIYSNEENKEFTKEEEKSLSLKEPIGKLLSLEGKNKTESIGKGKMYANVNSAEKTNNTEYEVTWQVNVGYKENLEGIKLEDGGEKIISAYGQTYDISKYVKYKTTTISKESFLDVLGEDGKISVLNEEGRELGVVNKATRVDENGDFLILYFEDVSKVILKTSTPIKEGNLVITQKKAITGSLPYSKAEIEAFSKLVDTNNLYQKEKDAKDFLQTEQKQVELPFEETKTKARLTISKEKLSTVVKNENVEFKIELGNNTDTSDLYIDPMFDIELPSYIEDINIKEYKILYDDELVIKDIQKLQKDGKIVLRVQLEGIQTKFSTGSVTNGTNIVLNTDIKLNILTPSKADEIKMYYYNLNTKNYENLIQTENGLAGLTTLEISYAAPNGLISVSNWTKFDETGRQLMSVNQGKMVEQIGVYNKAQLSQMDLILVNNTGNVCDGISILGKIPTKGSKIVVEGEELETTIDTNLRSYISAQGIDSSKLKIYYSENINATKDLSNANNNWKETIEDMTKVRAFLIVANDYQMQAGELISFSYNLEVPEKMSYNNNIYSDFVSYYTENSKEASLKQESKADVVGITTGKGPDLKIEQEVSGADENGKVKEYGILKYKIKVTNNGTETAKNVVIKDQIPKWTTYVRSLYENNNSYIFSKAFPMSDATEETMKEWNVVENGNYETGATPKLEWQVEQIQPGETVIKEFEILTGDTPDVYSYYKDYPGFTMEEDGKCYITTQTYDVNTDSSTEHKNELTEVPEIDIQNVATVTASNFLAELKAEAANVTLNKSDLQVEETMMGVNAEGSVEADDQITISIMVTNKTENEVKNVTIEKTLPEGLRYVSGGINQVNEETGEDSQISASYDKNTGKITATQDSLAANGTMNMSIVVKAKSLEDGVYEKEIKTNSKVMADGYEGATTNELTIKVEKPQIVVTQECSNNSEYLKEGDEVEYIINVENRGKSTVKGLHIKQYIPEEVKFIKANYKLYGTQSHANMNKNREVSVTGSLKAGENIRLVIQVKVLAIGEDKIITNIAEVYGDNTDYIITDGIHQLVEKSSNNSSNNNAGNNNNNNSGSTDITDSGNRISGTAWLDENENGKRDNQEGLLGGITVMAIDSNTGNIATKQDGTEARTTTDDNGRYLIENLKTGNYIVVFLYDTKIYTVTKYQASDAGVLLNSDAIEREITQDGQTKLAGVTDTIKLERSTSNIDLGLITREKFDLKLDKVVTKVSVQNKEGLKTHEYNDTTLAKVDITGKQLQNSTIVVEYKLKVTNEGNVAGYAKSIVDYLPKELNFNSELNTSWYTGNDGKLYTNELANQLINPGESKEIKLILTKKLTEDSTGIINNTAELQETYNEQGLKDKDSTAGNNAQGEDDQGSADVLITVRTGGTMILGTILVLAILALVIVGAYLMKKKGILKS